MKNIIFLAPIAAGKGTQSELLKKKYDYVHISTGDMFREIIASGSRLGEEVKNIINSGKLIDDELTIKLVSDKLDDNIGKPFILDGFPRNQFQAKILNKMLNERKIDYVVIYLDLAESVAMKRTLGRLVCNCGMSYNLNIDELKPKLENICDKCGEGLKKRDEDSEETFKIRYQNLMNNLNPVLDIYRDLHKLSVIDANREVEDIFKSIEEVITND